MTYVSYIYKSLRSDALYTQHYCYNRVNIITLFLFVIYMLFIKKIIDLNWIV